MVARRLLPLPSSDVLHPPDRPIASTRPRSPSGHTCRCGRWHHNLRATRTRGIVEGDRVVGGVRRDARHVAVDRRDQIDARRRVIERRLGQDFGHDHPRSGDRNMELLPATRAASAVFRGGPFAFADYRESRAVDDEVHGFAPWDSTKGELEVLAAPRERRLIGRGQIEAHQPEERRQEPVLSKNPIDAVRRADSTLDARRVATFVTAESLCSARPVCRLFPKCCSASSWPSRAGSTSSRVTSLTLSRQRIASSEGSSVLAVSGSPTPSAGAGPQRPSASGDGYAVTCTPWSRPIPSSAGIDS